MRILNLPIAYLALLFCSSCLPVEEEINSCGLVIGYSGQKVTPAGARLKGEVTIVGEIDSVGFELSESPNFVSGTTRKLYKVFLGGKPDTFDIQISGLVANRIYFYKASAKSLRKNCSTESPRLELKTPLF